MIDPSTTRVRRARARRVGAAVLLATGLAVGTVGVALPSSSAVAAPVAAAEVVGLTKGARGEPVRALQAALNRVGIGVKYGVDGYFGSATQASVRAFQRYKGLPVTGVVDAATATALGFAQPAPAPSAAARGGSGVLALGARGTKVRELQQALTAAGIAPSGGVDGIFGAGTRRALITFQQSKGLATSGVLDAATSAALSAVAAPAPPAAPAAATSIVGLQLGAIGPLVAQLQQAIMKMGWPLVRGADGTFGTGTKNALAAVQRANGLSPTGVVDDRTARLLNLTGAAPSPAPASAAAATGSTAAGYPVFDEHGARVVALQQALAAAGVALRGGADGVFGSSTLNGVLAIQRSRGLPATGKVDAATAGALGLAPMDPPAASAPVTITLEAKPVQGPCYYGDTWLAARSVGRVHLGVDIAAKEGNELYAVASGTVTKIYTVEKDPLTGNGLRITRPDGTYFFYGHLSAFPPGLAVGTAVTAGQVVGYVGRTGNAGMPHLHLEVHPGGGSAVNPYPIVKAIGAC
jgi:peptidoglycan hydrolase-like protein with peptidoglycan-binding domain